ncbi:hypothetical protein E6O75_ATG07545 [Venturia nashicola]|uniref:Hydrophobin n=1 Tax=Venturia nashicola TaxID=86259 RepID=A0A4Z1P6T8_9PEZI|nr:hypothetical protein E6O75_ATG07545 [Venturia nashicola]
MFNLIFFVMALMGIAFASPAALEQRRADWPIDCSHNGGQPYCCQGTFAGDLPAITLLAGLINFPLNPNDVNCIGVSDASSTCVGVNTCCQTKGVLS